MKDLVRNKTLVITGGTGYIGSRCVYAARERGYRVIAVDKINPEKRGVSFPAGVEFRGGDLRDPRFALQAIGGAEILLHLAANIGPLYYMQDHQAEILRDNSLIDASVFEAAVKNGKPCMVYASSSMVFQHALLYPYREEDLAGTPIPSNVYGFSKLAGEFFCRAYGAEHQLSSVVIRYHNVYGPGEDVKGSTPGHIHVIPALIEKVFSGQYPIELLGGERATRPFTYVDDVVRATMQIVEGAAEGRDEVVGSDFNIGPGEATSIVELAEIIWELCGNGRPFRYTVREIAANTAERREMNSDKISRMIGWQPQVGLREGIIKTIEWLKRKHAGEHTTILG